MFAIGKRKENQAQKWLSKQGLKCVEENFRCRGGEIDLICRHDDYLVFIEVKYRKNLDHGHPSEFVTAGKQGKIRHCAEVFLQSHAEYQSCPMRFDVITFSGNDTQPEWIQNAF
ncbi:YraN family protein [Thiomicrorhabdus sp.]|uniref:YraN family protein n=1 Tax=Thiomicrorhabdus sp. TaxID=2039724 RepID=UPI0029C6C3B4|nr:YraN family protein [Thiomicrorhabdus sp.]